MQSSKNAVEKNTYWHLAVVRNCADIDKILTRIADTEDVNRHNNNGSIPLLYAVVRNSSSVIDILIQKGADVNFIDPDGNSPITIAINRGDPEILHPRMQRN